MQVLVDWAAECPRRMILRVGHYSPIVWSCILRLICFLVVSILPTLLWAGDLASQRTQFQAAWRIAQTGSDASAKVSGLEDYPLYPYLPYERLRRMPDKAVFKEVQQFLAEYGDTMPGHRLRAQVLERYGRLGRNEDFLTLYQEDQASVDLRCLAFTAKRARKVAGDAQAEALALYAAMDKDRADCRPLLTWMRSQHLMTPERVRARIDQAIVAGQTGLAQVLSNDLPKAEQAGAQRRILARAEPSVALNQASKWPVNGQSAEAASIALTQSARKGAMAAEIRYQALARLLPFDAAQKSRIEAEIARFAAVERLPEAKALLARVSEAGFDDNLREWQVRYHLRRLEWKEALAAVDGMSAELGGKSNWRYTRGRLLELLGRADESQADFQAAAKEANFHGFLAADRVGAAYAICPADALLDTNRALEVLSMGGISRALEWLALGDIDRARAEWFWQLTSLNPQQRREAGLIANREGQYEWAIFTLNTPELMRQYEARFPLLEVETVQQEAKRAGLPEAWVFGLIRAESAWNPNARSPVGARGLMQLMPQTAASVTKSLGIRDNPLTDPAHNIRLGTTYLSLRYGNLGNNPILATGAYNAGIGAVKRWIGEPLPPWDLWVETVPYKETREYIARVLAFAVLYDWRIDGSPQRLSAMIPGLGIKSEPAPISCQ